jgi:NADPH-dependent ferric siderophore reductase
MTTQPTTTQPTTTQPTTTQKPRRRFRPVEVVGVHRVTPRIVSVALGGEALADFEITAPTQHVKLLFPAPGQEAPALPESGPDGLRFPEDQPRPVMRTFTPRRFNADTSTLDVEFVLHGEGPAAAWASQAAPGQRLAVAGPGGRMPLALGPGRWIVAGDESALPAIGTFLDALPASASAHVYLEVDDRSDEIRLESAADVTTTWLRRAPGAFGEALHTAVTGADVTGASGVWVACEAMAVRRIRRTLLSEPTVDPASLVTRGYWRLGEQNHPDHDYGEDAA